MAGLSFHNNNIIGEYTARCDNIAADLLINPLEQLQGSQYI